MLEDNTCDQRITRLAVDMDIHRDLHDGYGFFVISMDMVDIHQVVVDMVKILTCWVNFNFV